MSDELTKASSPTASAASAPPPPQHSPSCWSKTKSFLNTYFWQGQQLTEKARAIDPDAPFYVRHRKLIATFLPALIVHIVWWTVMIKNDYWYKFTETSGAAGKERWAMSITMVFGSMIAGATSEGGAAIAFPVMTLALGIAPPVARDFSFMIQSVGMVAAAFTILFMRVAVEWMSLIYVSIGGVAGIIIGLEYVAPQLTPPYAKMYFVVIWSSFAVGLFMLNRNHDRVVYPGIPNFHEGVMWRAPGSLGKFIFFNWKRETLIAFGVLGGVFSGMSGSGIDICSFSALTLLFRVSEKVATPTSVILMAINTTVGFAYREFAMGGVNEDAWGFLLVCAPIVVIGAPIGSFLGSHFHRLTLAGIIYFIDAAQLIGALVVVRPWSDLKTDTPLHLSITSLVMFIGGMVFFRLLAYFGLRFMSNIEAEKALELEEKGMADDSKQTESVEMSNREGEGTENV